MIMTHWATSYLNQIIQMNMITTHVLSGHAGGGVNAVKKVYRNNSWKGFSYDGRGNMTKGDGLVSATYNAMDKPVQINKNGHTTEFYYGSNHMRFKQVRGDSTTYYADKGYEVEAKGLEVTWRAYISDVAIVSKKINASATVDYSLKDRLGSTRAFVTHLGQVSPSTDSNPTSLRNYDAFGKPRDINGIDDSSLASKDKSRRGFTDHEHLDELQLIHMNGRVYDYNLGRFYEC